MSRIQNSPGDQDKPRIDRAEVDAFFRQRAERIPDLGPVRAVIYQDKHLDLAERRDVAEKARIYPRLRLDGTQRLLDVGCGTGRWASTLSGSCAHYHGIDACEGLVAHARLQFAGSANCRFTVASADSFSLASIGEAEPFDRVLCAGVLIYLNDDELVRALQCIAGAMAPGALAVFREPMGIERRLTIKDHFSDDMEQTYNAIYRTRDEIAGFVATAMSGNGCRLADSGDVYEEQALNNRAETRQRWFVVERAA